jgi:hypothetical protein
MTESEREALLEVHIPYRMTAVDGMRWACRYLIENDADGQIGLRRGGVELFTSETVRIFTNPVIEMGAVSCRVLLEFLGLRLDQTATPPVMRGVPTRMGDDIGIEDFGLPRVTLDDLDAVSLEIPGWGRQVCAETVYISNKAIAHLTRAPVDLEALPQLSDCGLATLRLMERHVYGALGRRLANYRLWPNSTSRPA